MRQFTCGVCKSLYTETRSDEERKWDVLERYGPVIATQSSEFVPVCPRCEEEINKKITPEMIEKAKAELFKQKHN